MRMNFRFFLCFEFCSYYNTDEGLFCMLRADNCRTKSVYTVSGKDKGRYIKVNRHFANLPMETVVAVRGINIG